MWCAVTPTVHCSAAVVFFQSASLRPSRRIVASATLASNCRANASPLAPMVFLLGGPLPTETNGALGDRHSGPAFRAGIRTARHVISLSARSSNSWGIQSGGRLGAVDMRIGGFASGRWLVGDLLALAVDVARAHARGAANRHAE